MLSYRHLFGRTKIFQPTMMMISFMQHQRHVSRITEGPLFRVSHTNTRKYPRVVKMRATVATSDRKRPMCSPRELFSKDKHPTGPGHLLACLQLCETPATGARGHQIKLKFPRHRKTLLPLSSEHTFSNRGKIIHAPARVLGCCQMLAKMNPTKSAKSWTRCDSPVGKHLQNLRLMSQIKFRSRCYTQLNLWRYYFFLLKNTKMINCHKLDNWTELNEKFLNIVETESNSIF